MKNKYHAAVIGLGRTGFLYDRDGFKSLAPRSHATIYHESDRYELVGVVDGEKARREAFSKFLRSVPTYSSVTDLFNEQEVDVLSVCTPPNFHYTVIDEALKHPLKVIFCEKPLAFGYEEALRIYREAVFRGVQIAVNYHRRWDKGHRDFLECVLADGQIPLYIRGLYNKGLYNYASHMVDLILQVFSTVDGVQVLRHGGNPSGEEANLSFRMFSENNRWADVIGVQGVQYDLFELEFFSDDSVYALHYGGAEKVKYTSRDGVFYPGYKHTVVDPSGRFPKGPVGGLREAIENLLKFLDGETLSIRCTALDALKVHQILEGVKAASAKGLGYITLEGGARL